MRKVIITGASDGIGKAIAKRLSGEFELVLFGRDETRLKAVAEECGGAEYYAFDMNDKAARDEVASRINDVDILINNAGVWHKVGNLEDISEEKVVEVLNTNLVSQIMLTHSLISGMKSRKGSAVINVISKSGVVSQAGQSVYTASKYGMRGFTDVLRVDTKDDAIKIGAVYQSGTDTDMFRKAGEEFDTDAFTQPGDLADAVHYMLTRPKHMWINEMRVDK